MANSILRESTATAYVIEKRQLLMIFHPKFNKWLPPGGHIEENELPHQAAIREVLEETGYHIAIEDDHPLDIQALNARRLPHPFLVLLEEIEEYKEMPFHQHIDYIYKARLIKEKRLLTHEALEMKWFSVKELQALDSVDIFEETKKSALHLLKSVL